MQLGEKEKEKIFYKNISSDLYLANAWVEGGNNGCRSLSKDTLTALVRLDRLRTLIHSVWGVDLSPVRRADWSLSSLRSFCDELIEKVPTNPWRIVLREKHASLQVRVSVAATVFLFRKVVPVELSEAQKKQKIQNYIEKMSNDSPVLPEDLADTARRELSRMFPFGWDDKLDQYKANFTLPTSACLERPRRQGGPRGGDRKELRGLFQDFFAGKDVFISNKTEPKMIWTGGKWRLVTVFSERRSFIAPIHRMIYDRISRFDWCLRGDAVPAAFKGFKRVDGEVFVSGDYESATDNLNVNLSKFILSEIFRRSINIAPTVKEACFNTLANELAPGRIQGRGQLMGSLLSFPLLCIANYLTFKLAVPRQGVPVRINGDDIVFRGTPQEKDRWFLEVAKAGLVVSRGKTLVQSSWFSLNSTFFLATEDTVQLCPIIRSKALFGPVEDPNEIGGRLKGVFNGGGKRLDLVHSACLREMSTGIWSSQRSLRRGLDATLSWRAIKMAGMLERENFYNSLPREEPLPLPKAEWRQNAVPSGWERVPITHTKNPDPQEFFEAMVECCWVNEPIVEGGSDDYWERVREKTFTFVKRPRSRPLFTNFGFHSREVFERRVNTPRRVKNVWRKAKRKSVLGLRPEEEELEFTSDRQGIWWDGDEFPYFTIVDSCQSFVPSSTLLEVEEE